MICTFKYSLVLETCNKRQDNTATRIHEKPGARQGSRKKRLLSRNIKAPWDQWMPELRAEFCRCKAGQHYQLWLRWERQANERIKGTSAEVLGRSHTAEWRRAKRMWIGSQAQPQKGMKKPQKEQSLCEYLCPSCPSVLLSRNFL